MNMISTGAFQTEMDSSIEQETLAKKFARVWEKKNSKAAKAGGVSLMALTLAACGSDDAAVVDPAPVDPAPVDPAPVDPTPVTPTVNTITKALLDFSSGDTLAGTAGDDVLNVEINAALGATTTISGIETINVTGYGALSVDFTKITDVTKFVTTGSTGQMTLNNISDATMTIGFAGSGTNDIVANYKAGTLTGSNDTLNIDVNGASAVAIDADAGFENIALHTGGASSSAGQAATAASGLTTLTVPGVTTMDITGDGGLTLNSTFSGMTSIDASAMTGAIKGATINATTGLSTEGFTGATGGTTVKLGSAADNIKFTDATSAATKSNTIKLGAGNDTADVVTGGSGATYIFGEAGDDAVQVNGLASTDLVDLGAGNDTLTVAGTNANAILRGVETLKVAAGATLSISSADTALVTSAAANGGAVDVTGLSAGSAVTVTKAASATQATNVTVGYAASEAAATVEVGGGMSGTLTTSKIADTTINLTAASTLGGHTSFTGATALTINATGALAGGKNIVDAAATDTLKTVAITGSAAVTMGTITSTAMTSASVTATTGDATTGNIGADATGLTSVTISAPAGAIAGDMAIGQSSNTGVMAVTASAKNAIDLGAIISTKLGDISISNTNPLAKTIDVGAVGSDATTMGNLTITGSGNITTGLIGNTTESIATAGTIAMTSTLGKVDFDNINTKVATGLTVDLTAKTNIDSDGSGTAATVENVGGNIQASLAGAAAAVVNYTATTSGVVNLTASNTGGLTTTITNAGTVGAGETSTINLGNAATSKTNSVTLKGTVDSVVINGGTGTDTIAFNATNDIASGTIALGTGTNTVDFTEVDTVSSLTDTGSDNGIAVNLSSSTVTFDSGTAYASSIASGKATGYDASGDENHATQTSTNIVGSDFMYSLSGVTNVIGSDAADYIVANSTGTTITGGTGADIIVTGAGADTVKFTATTDGQTFGALTSITATTDDETVATDDINGFTVGTDFIKIDGTLKSALEASGASALSSGSGTTLDYNAAGILIIRSSDTKLSGDDFGDVSVVASTFNTEVTASNGAAGDEILFSVENNSGTETGLYYLKFGGANATGQIAATDTLILLGVFDAVGMTATEIAVA